jgi:ligand-binding sensor domain-containing protein
MVGNALKCVCVDREGRIWAGSNEGMNCLEGDRRTFYSVAEGLPDRITTLVYEDRGGRMWVGTYSGLAYWADGKMVPRPINEGFSGDRVLAVFEDREEKSLGRHLGWPLPADPCAVHHVHDTARAVVQQRDVGLRRQVGGR